LRYNTKQLTANVDLAPTLVELLGLNNHKEVRPYLSNFSGYSLLQPIESDRKVISLNNNQIASFNTGISIAHKNWHYLYRTNIVPNKEELYFWKKDLGEMHNKVNSLSKTQRQGIINFISTYPVCSKFITLMSTN
jgi:arylsulfatase A-like enzyme